jgi:hypothetical protein
MVTSTVSRAQARQQARQQAQRLLHVASDLTEKKIVGKIVQAGPRTLLLIGVVDDKTDEATRLHHALLEVSKRERFEVDVVIVTGTAG